MKRTSANAWGRGSRELRIIVRSDKAIDVLRQAYKAPERRSRSRYALWGWRISPHFASISRASSADNAEGCGNLSIHANGRQASTMALAWEATPRSFSSGEMRGSSAELQ